jgi:hypothetical protein
MQHKLFSVGYILILIALSCAGASCDRWTNSQVTETKRRGEIVRHALDQYRDRTGAYPSTLNLLVPAEIRAIPKPTLGERDWNYEVFGGGTSYVLSVKIRSESEPLLQATSESGWTFDTK